MTHYAAHIIMVVKTKGTGQFRYPVWENIVLFSARNVEEAFAKAEQYGKAEEGDDDGTFRWGRKAATWVYSGVRKLVPCEGFAKTVDGIEISTNQYEVQSLEAVEKLVAGEPTILTLDDPFEDAEAASAPSKASRRPA